MEPDITKRWRVEQIVTSEWMAMDNRLMQMTAAEEMALAHAQQEKQSYIDSLNKKATGLDRKTGQMSEMKVLKTSAPEGEKAKKTDKD
nr:unnamed protein product [Callosobruchus analis]